MSIPTQDIRAIRNKCHDSFDTCSLIVSAVTDCEKLPEQMWRALLAVLLHIKSAYVKQIEVRGKSE